MFLSVDVCKRFFVYEERGGKYRLHISNNNVKDDFFVSTLCFMSYSDNLQLTYKIHKSTTDEKI